MTRYTRNALLVVCSIALLWTTGLQWGLSKSDWAAWVQALGSVAAIVGAVWLVEKQVLAARQLEADRRHLDDLLKTEVLNQLFAFAVGTCDSILRSTKGEAVNIELRASQLSDCISAVEAIPPLDVPGEGLALARLHLPRALKELQEALQGHLEERSFWDGSGSAYGASEQFMTALHHAGVVARSSRDVAQLQVEKLRKLARVSD